MDTSYINFLDNKNTILYKNFELLIYDSYDAIKNQSFTKREKVAQKDVL